MEIKFYTDKTMQYEIPKEVIERDSWWEGSVYVYKPKMWDINTPIKLKLLK